MFNASLDVRKFLGDIDAAAEKQLPFAISKALNMTGTQFQEAERIRIRQAFTLRRPDFMLRTVKIERANFATKTDLRTIVGIDPTRDMLSKFENDGQKTSRRAGGMVAVPEGATRNKSDIIPQFARPKAFLIADTTSPNDRMPGKGKQRTFLIRTASGAELLLQRVGKRSKAYGHGKGRDPNLKLLWVMVRQVHIAPRLSFVQNAVVVMRDRWPDNIRKAFDDAMRTAK